MNYNFTYEETLEHEKHRVFPSDMSKWTMVALAHHKNVLRALNKQIPKAPIWRGDGHSDYDIWHCPNCDYGFEYDDPHWFCPVCGQAIDWSRNNG